MFHWPKNHLIPKGFKSMMYLEQREPDIFSKQRLEMGTAMPVSFLDARESQRKDPQMYSYMFKS